MEMKIISILLCSLDKVKDFTNAVNKVDGKVTLSSGSYSVEAKSIMAIFTLDLTKPLIMNVEQWKDEYAELFFKYQV